MYLIFMLLPNVSFFLKRRIFKERNCIEKYYSKLLENAIAALCNVFIQYIKLFFLSIKYVAYIVTLLFVVSLHMSLLLLVHIVVSGVEGKFTYFKWNTIFNIFRQGLELTRLYCIQDY